MHFEKHLMESIYMLLVQCLQNFGWLTTEHILMLLKMDSNFFLLQQ